MMMDFQTLLDRQPIRTVLAACAVAWVVMVTGAGGIGAGLDVQIGLTLGAALATLNFLLHSATLRAVLRPQRSVAVVFGFLFPLRYLLIGALAAGVILHSERLGAYLSGFCIGLTAVFLAITGIGVRLWVTSRWRETPAFSARSEK